MVYYFAAEMWGLFHMNWVTGLSLRGTPVGLNALPAQLGGAWKARGLASHNGFRVSHSPGPLFPPCHWFYSGVIHK